MCEIKPRKDPVKVESPEKSRSPTPEPVPIFNKPTPKKNLARPVRSNTFFAPDNLMPPKAIADIRQALNEIKIKSRITEKPDYDWDTTQNLQPQKELKQNYTPGDWNCETPKQESIQLLSQGKEIVEDFEEVWD